MAFTETLRTITSILSTDFLIEFKSYINWSTICVWKNFNIEELTIFYDKIHWRNISQSNHNLSDEIMTKFQKEFRPHNNFLCKFKSICFQAFSKLYI